MQLELQLYSGSLGLWSVRRTAGRPVVGKPRGMACRCVARQNNTYWPILIHQTATVVIFINKYDYLQIFYFKKKETSVFGFMRFSQIKDK